MPARPDIPIPHESEDEGDDVEVRNNKNSIHNLTAAVIGQPYILAVLLLLLLLAAALLLCKYAALTCASCYGRAVHVGVLG